MVETSLGKHDRIMTFIAPRHGKSTLKSKAWPAWHLGHWPDDEFMLLTYGDDFAREWGRGTRDLLDEHGQELFGVSVRQDSSAADRFQMLGHAGGMKTAGILGSVTGRGAGVLGIDDVLKNQQEANSKLIRDRIWDTYITTARLRLNPGGRIAITNTRWHVDDLCGRLLEKEGRVEDGGRWLVTNLPAIAQENDPLGREPGEALWPERFPLHVLEEIRKLQGEYWFQAMFQGNPIVRSGGMFERNDFEVVDKAILQTAVRTVRCWDLAATEDDGTDPSFTAGLGYALLADGRYCVTDLQHFRDRPSEVRRKVRATATQDGPDVVQGIPQDPGQAGKDQWAEYVAMLAPYPVVRVSQQGDKTLRAEPVAAMAGIKNIVLVRGDWNDTFLTEIEAYPRSPHNDILDALSGAHRMMNPTEWDALLEYEDPDQEISPY